MIIVCKWWPGYTTIHQIKARTAIYPFTDKHPRITAAATATPRQQARVR